ncbi:hypothetical protein Tco_0471174 [Tanacetum coccineum]
MQLMRFSYRTKTIVGPEVNNMTTHIIASTWNLVDRSLTSAKIRPLSGIVPSTIDTKYSVELADGKVIRIDTITDEPLAIPLDEIQDDDKLNFIEEPVEVMDREVKRLKQSRIPIVKVCWNSKRGLEFTEK